MKIAKRAQLVHEKVQRRLESAQRIGEGDGGLGRRQDKSCDLLVWFAVTLPVQ